MYCLLLDSANKYLCVGLSKDKKVIDKVFYEAWQRQSEVMIEEIDNLLKRNNVAKKDLSAVVVGVGPGSYTGVRIAITIAKTICYALHIKMYGVSSLKILEDNSDPTICVFNARSGRSYVGVYHNDEIILDDQVMENDKLLSYISSHQDYKISGDAKHLGIKHEEVDVIANLAKAENDINLVEDIFALKPKYLKEIK